MEKPKIVLYGHFGSGNVGNDSSFEAALRNIQAYLPRADITCVCNGPEDISARFGIKTLPIDSAERIEYRGVSRPNRSLSSFARIINRVLDEIRFWTYRPTWFSSIDLFAVVGTGAVDDMAIRWPWNAPYDLYKWCKAAKMGGARVAFLSVGVGPIVNPISRFLML